MEPCRVSMQPQTQLFIYFEIVTSPIDTIIINLWHYHYCQQPTDAKSRTKNVPWSGRAQELIEFEAPTT